MQPQFTKPPDAGGYYLGHPPPSLPARPRKRRQPEFQPEPDIHERIQTLMKASHRDFLVVRVGVCGEGGI